MILDGLIGGFIFLFLPLESCEFLVEAGVVDYG